MTIVPLSASAFAAYCAPAQALAFASRYSLASLPVMIANAERAGLPASATRVVIRSP
ncbi:MAG: hypothetical protein IT180_03890 [Acidobacteria bacterium]|nr:hypothetical protein [Acidobacteriota bacterium]